MIIDAAGNKSSRDLKRSVVLCKLMNNDGCENKTCRAVTRVAHHVIRMIIDTAGKNVIAQLEEMLQSVQ